MSWELYYDEKLSYMLGIDILRNSAHKKIECPEGVRGDFFRVWASKRHPDALLAKTMQ